MFMHGTTVCASDARAADKPAADDGKEGGGKESGREGGVWLSNRLGPRTADAPSACGSPPGGAPSPRIARRRRR